MIQCETLSQTNKQSKPNQVNKYINKEEKGLEVPWRHLGGLARASSTVVHRGAVGRSFSEAWLCLGTPGSIHLSGGEMERWAVAVPLSLLASCSCLPVSAETAAPWLALPSSSSLPYCLEISRGSTTPMTPGKLYRRFC